jgi:UNC-50 family
MYGFSDNGLFAETKAQFARDDPAFLVLLSLWLLGKLNLRCDFN